VDRKRRETREVEQSDRKREKRRSTGVRLLREKEADESPSHK
jgi:hypothetical protein